MESGATKLREEIEKQRVEIDAKRIKLEQLTSIRENLSEADRSALAFWPPVLILLRIILGLFILIFIVLAFLVIRMY